MNEVDEFLSKKQYFQLGGLSTESPNPLTMNLSQLAQNDLDAGLRIMRQIDLAALRKTLAGFDDYQELFRAVAETLEEGQRIYLVGCGATGRLSLSLEHLWRRRNPSSDQVRSLMAGGDVALVHSLEGFEDFPQFGARHLKQLGFANGDLVIATTEGGETPYVIGAVELAALELPPRAIFSLLQFAKDFDRESGTIKTCFRKSQDKIAVLGSGPNGSERKHPHAGQHCLDAGSGTCAGIRRGLEKGRARTANVDLLLGKISGACLAGIYFARSRDLPRR